MPEDTFEDVRQRLFEAAWDAPAYPPAPERTVARARRRAATTIGGAALAAILAIVVAAAALPFGAKDPNVGVPPRDVDDREFLVDIRTGHTTELTSNPTFDRMWWPNVSPDGERIAFTTDTTGSLQLYVADLDGSNVHQLTGGLGFTDVYDLAWSSSGDKIAFGALDPAFSLTRNLYVVDLATERVRRVTNESKDPWSPEWSPDDRSILYSVIIPGTFPEVEGVYATVDSGQLRLVDVDTKRVQKIFGGPKVLAGDATWTPDGIVFVRGRDLTPDGPNKVDLALLRGESRHPEHLMNVPTNDRFSWTPELSPDGSTIAYARDSSQGPQMIFLYDVATGRNRVLRAGHWVTWVDSDTLLVQGAGRRVTPVTHSA
jgi:Tol biopolymer transport system component